jgi:hypothetical protein
VERDAFTDSLRDVLIQFSRQFEDAWDQETQAAKEEA